MLQSWSKSFFTQACGILIMTLLSGSIIYGAYYASIPSEEFSYYNPTLIQYHISSYALIVLIFSIFGLISLILTLVAYHMKPDSKINFYIPSIATGILLIFTIAYEGVFYSTVYKDFTYHADTQFINNSKARSFVKKSLKVLYEKGMENLKEEYGKEEFFKNHVWNDFSKNLLGKKINNTDDHPYQHIIQYADLWDSCSDDDKDHLVFKVSKTSDNYYYIAATYNNYNGTVYSFPVATITFNSSEYKKRYHLGYFENKKIHYINHLDDKALPFKPVSTGDNRTLQLNVALINGKYISSYRAYRENYQITYILDHFPMAFKILSHQEAKDALNDTRKFVVEEASNQIGGFNIKKVLKKQGELNLKLNKTTFFNCSKDFVNDKNLTKHCNLDYPFYPFEYEDPNDTPFYNVGYRPHFQKASASEFARNLVFYYKDYFRVARFSLTNLIIQVFGIVYAIIVNIL